MKKILFVGNDIAFFISHRLPLAEEALAAGYAVHVAMPEPENHHSVQVLRDMRINYHSFFMRRMGVNPLYEMLSIWHLFRLYRTLKPDLVHHIAMKAILYGGISSLFSNPKQTVFAFTGLGTLFTHEDPATKLLRRIITPVYKSIFFPTRAWAIFQNPDDLRLFTYQKRITRANRSFLIRSSGVNLREFPYSKEPLSKPPVVMLAARMLKTKGVREFVEAAEMLHKRGWEAHFVLVGDAPVNHDTITKEQLHAWEKAGAIEWWGRQENMPRILAQANIICLPAHFREGVPKVLLEAAACGRAIIASNIPGCREITEHRMNGLLIEPRNSRALAAAIEILLRNPDKRQRMGRYGRQLVESEFSVERVVGETLKIYQKLLS